MRPASTTLGIIALAASGLVAQQKPGPYTERVEVARVLIDARVLDDRGQAIRDLRVDDFSVIIGGKAARVESLEWVSGVPADEAAPLESAAFDPFLQRQGRLIVFVFQKSLERGRIVGFMRMLIEARGVLDTLTP